MALSLSPVLSNCHQQQNQADPNISRNAFSILGKRKSPDSASKDDSTSVKAALHRGNSKSRPSLTQMQLYVGQIVQKRCIQCGMSYVVSSLEDRRLHDKFHAQSTMGYFLGREFVAKSPIDSVFKVGSDSICALHCFDQPHRKRKAQAALEIVQKELGAVKIEAPELWNAKNLTLDRYNRKAPVYCAYMYVREGYCIGFLLVHDITEAFVVREPKMPSPPIQNETPLVRGTTALAALQARRTAASNAKLTCEARSLEYSEQKAPARLGVSRIWTASACRQQGIALQLLDTALEHQISSIGMHPTHLARNKDDVAFSQPTQAGTRLARKWFGKPYGWLVYAS